MPPARVRPPLWFVALGATAAGAWCTRGVLDIVDGPNGTVTRIAMLPPVWLLVALVLLLGVVGFAAIRMRLDADAALPLVALGLIAVPYLPWLADRVPVLRAAAGPARFILWAVVAWMIVCFAPVSLSRRVSARISAPMIFLAGAMVYGGAAWRMTGTPLFPGGDEPHYLIITQSLLHDGDLEISNNHRREEYRAYFNGSLKPDYLALGKNGGIYSIHPVGLPVVAIPAFALAGYRGVVAMLVAMAALAGALLWRWTRELTGSPGAATFAWAATALTAPFVFNSFTVYPEIPAALCVIAVIGWRPDSTSSRVMWLKGAAVGALPWLSTKYAPMAGAVAVVTLLRIGWRPRAVMNLLAPAGIALVAWFAFFLWIWGTPSPSAPYGASEPTTWRHLGHGAPGLIFDQEYGVVFAAPVLVIAFAGVIRMLRAGGTSARRALELTFIFGALLCTVGAFHIWWGGEASPGRPVASGVLMFGVPIGIFFAASEGRPSARAGCHILLAFSLAIVVALLAVQSGALIHQDRDGSAVVLDWISPTWQLAPAFPTFLVGSLGAAIWRTVVWLAIGGMVAWLVGRLQPRGLGSAALATMGFSIAVGSAYVSLLWNSTPPPPAMRADARARVPLLDRFDGERLPTDVLYDPFSRIEPADVLSHVTLVARPGLRIAPQPIDLLWNARFALPAGVYRLQLTRTGAPAVDASVSLQVGRTGSPIETWHVAGARWEHLFVLPIDAALVGFRASEPAQIEGELQLTPVTIVDEARRIARRPVIAAQRYGRATAYFHDDQTFIENTGYWIRGRAESQVTYVAGGESDAPLEVTIRCGPVRNRVTLSAHGWEQRVQVDAGASARVSIPALRLPPLEVRTAPIQIRVDEGFVPADVDRTSADRRFLGCRIEAAS